MAAHPSSWRGPAASQHPPGGLGFQEAALSSVAPLRVLSHCSSIFTVGCDGGITGLYPPSYLSSLRERGRGVTQNVLGVCGRMLGSGTGVSGFLIARIQLEQAVATPPRIWPAVRCREGRRPHPHLFLAACDSAGWAKQRGDCMGWRKVNRPVPTPLPRGSSPAAGPLRPELWAGRARLLCLFTPTFLTV